MKFSFVQRVACVALGAALAALCVVPVASGWSAVVPQSGVVHIERSDAETGTLTLTIWYRGSQPSASSFADGSYDTTSSGWSSVRVIRMDPDARAVEYLYSGGAYFLVTASDGCREFFGGQANEVNVNIAQVGGSDVTTLPVSMVSTVGVSSMPSVAVSSMPSVGLTAAIATTDSPLPVLVQSAPNTDTTGTLAAWIVAFSCGSVLGFRGVGA